MIYLSISLLGLYLFGDNVQSSVLLNFGLPAYYSPITGQPYWQATVIQLSFLIMLLCNNPYTFYAGKESICCLVEEVQRNSISSVLIAKHPELVDTSINYAKVDEQVGLIQKSKSLVYKEMDTKHYLLCTFSLYIAEMVLACSVQSISIVFAFLSALIISALAFWVPGYYYLLATEKYTSDRLPDS